MGRAPCCDKANVKKGPWSPEEDAKLKEYIETTGTGGNWISLPQKAGLRRCGKSCRLRWLNYLRPNIKHGEFSDEEDRIICALYSSIGSRWSIIAAQLPGRTDNDIKNYWNTKLKKKLFGMFPQSQRKPQQHHIIHHPSSFSSLLQSYSPSASSPSPSPPLSSPSSTLLYNCSNPTYHTPEARPFTGFEVSYSSSYSNSSNSINSCVTAASSAFQPQESLLGTPMQQSYQLQEGLQMFGNEASCSSSDGSDCSYQISQNKESEHGYGEQIGMQNYNNLCNEADERQNKLIASNNGLWGETETAPLDYGLEEIKQLISTSTCNSFVF